MTELWSVVLENSLASAGGQLSALNTTECQ